MATGGLREVTIVAHDVGPVGGMERQLTELIEGLSSAGWAVTVIARRCELPPAVRVRHVRVPGPARPFALAYPWFLLAGSVITRLRRRGLVQSTGAIVLNRVDVCAVHLCHRGLAPTGLLRASRDRAAYRFNARIARWMSIAGERLSYTPRRCRVLAAVSNGVADELLRAYPRMRDRIEVIPNGVDADRFSPGDGAGPDTGARAVFVGGEWDGKGLAIAIDAIAQAPGWRLDVVGDGDVSRFARRAADAGVPDRVRFLGRREDPETVYAGAAAFVLPSVYETFSLVTYEAAASGVPLLATKVSGVEDVLADGVNGWFISRDAGDLAARLRELAADPGRRAQMGRAARRAALRFSWDRTVAEHVRLYDRLASA
jgi:glycosyltransferase involved in cell wall biosynthesis